MKLSFLKISWPYLVVILAHLIWGINFIIAKITLQEIPPLTLSFLRFTIAIIFLLPFLLKSKDELKIDKKDLPSFFAVGTLMATLNIALFYEGLLRTSPIQASVLTMTIPILSVLLGWWFLKEKIYTANLIGITLGLVGTFLIIGLPGIVAGLDINYSKLIGNILIILASLSWVIGAIVSKKLLTKYSTLTITTLAFLVGVVAFAIPALNEYLQNPLWITKITYLGIFGLFYIAIASSVSAYFLFEWGLKRIGVIKADLFQYIEPIIATTLGVLILGEGMRFSFLIGGLLIGLGVYWGSFAKENHKHPKYHRN